MSKPFVIAFGVALVVALALAVWWGSAGHVEYSGKIGKLRVQKVDENESIVILDFNLRNDSGRPRTVSSIKGNIENPDGSVIEGHAVGAVDLPNVFRNYPAMGPQFNPILKGLETLEAHQAVDRTVGLRFDAPDQAIAGRKDVVLDIEFINGPEVELKAK